MPKAIDLAEAVRLIDAGAHLVNILSRKKFEDSHLPGAMNIPLPELNEMAIASFDREAAVVAYCFDYEWDIRPRARGGSKPLDSPTCMTSSRGRRPGSHAVTRAKARLLPCLGRRPATRGCRHVLHRCAPRGGQRPRVRQ